MGQLKQNPTKHLPPPSSRECHGIKAHTVSTLGFTPISTYNLCHLG